MLDPFTRVFYTSEGLVFHAEEDCVTTSQKPNRRTPRRSRLASMLATGRVACKVCATHLAVSPTQALRIATDSLAMVPA